MTSMATWTDIKELATQLKQTQEKSSVHKLSERTWVDIVRHLINIQRLRLIYTCDGRSYLTKEELDKEIREEVDAHCGRVSFNEMASILDIDALLLETRVLELVAFDAQTSSTNRLLSIPGEVVSEAYVRQVAQEIQDKLEERGQISIGEIATSFSLPTAFLLNIINKYQGTLFKVQKFGDQYVTDAFMNENRAKVRGYFTAVMRPTTLSSASTKLQVPDTLLSSILSSFISNGHLCGSLAAARGTYIPSCYVRAEDAYVQSFYTQNGYIEWSHLKRMGISDPAGYTRSRFPNAIHVSGVSVGPMITDQLKATIEEVVRDANWADLTHILPVSLSESERVALVSPYLAKQPVRIIDDGTHIVADAFVVKCEPYFEAFIRNSAELAAKEGRKGTGSVQTPANVDHEQSAKRVNHSIKGGFGVGAREIKTKNVKKKYNPSKRRTETNIQHERDEDDSFITAGGKESGAYYAQYLPIEELEHVLASELSADTPSEVVSGIVSLLLPILEKTFANIVDSIFLPNSDTAHRRERLQKTQSTVNDMIFAMQLIERGINAVTEPLLRDQLLRHLIKQYGTTLIDHLCLYIASMHELDWPSNPRSKNETGQSEDTSVNTVSSAEYVGPLSPDQRRQLIVLLNRLNNPEASKLASALDKVLDGLKSVQSGLLCFTEFYQLVDTLADPIGISVCIRSSDNTGKRKREERTKANELAIQVELQLQQAVDSVHLEPSITRLASIVLSSTCLMAQVVTGWPVIAPGKCVPDLVTWLRRVISSKKPNSGCAAVDALFDSSGIEDLSLLTTAVTERMHSNQQSDGIDDPDLIQACDRLLELVKHCRRVLYS